MDSNDVFRIKDYRAVLKLYAEDGQLRGAISRLAEAAQCQQSHMSRVITGLQHLTLEQAFRLSRFLKLQADAATYFMKMVEFERAGDPAYREMLQRELKSLNARHENLLERLGEKAITDQERESLYYSNWFWSAIHIAVSIPQFQTVAAISRRLSLAESVVEECLEKLKTFGLVRKEKNRWMIASGGLHLSKASPHNSIQHLNWRLRAVVASQQPTEDGIHYTVVQSISKADFGEIKNILFKTIDSYAAIARPSQEEELVCFMCDFFKV